MAPFFKLSPQVESALRAALRGSKQALAAASGGCAAVGGERSDTIILKRTRGETSGQATKRARIP